MRKEPVMGSHYLPRWETDAYGASRSPWRALCVKEFPRPVGYQLSVETMSIIFIVLLFLSFAALVVGLIKPTLVKLPSRKGVSALFGGGAIIFFTLVGITAPSTPAVSPVVAALVVAATSSAPVSTNAQYTGAMQTSVLPFLLSADQDIVAASNAGGAGDFSTALQDAQGAQKTILKAKAGFAALQPPSSDLAEVNGLVGKAIDSYSNATDEMVAGIKNQNASTIRDAEAYITQGDAYATQASGLMQKMSAQ